MKREPPVLRMLKLAADAGIPASQVATLTGIRPDQPEAATPEQGARLAALVQLAMTYDGICQGQERAWQELPQAWEHAMAMGVWWDPPECVQHRMRRRALRIRMAAMMRDGK